MTTHHMKLSEAPFEKVAAGNKVIESRLYDEKRRQIKVGDLIEFTRNDDPNKKMLTRVVALYPYTTFEKLFSYFPPGDFGGSSRKELLDEIHQFYSMEDELLYGVVGIKIQLA